MRQDGVRGRRLHRADWGVAHRSETWGRAAGISFATNGTASAAVSRHLHKLKELKLISTEPYGRMTKITKLLEDGSGDPYTLPSGDKEGSRKSTYFKVPFAYWEQRYYRSLSMPAKTMLLILMSQRSPSFALHKAREYALWYGVSPSTVGRGIEELKKSACCTSSSPSSSWTASPSSGRARMSAGLSPRRST